MNDRSLLAGAADMVFAGSPLDRCEVLRRDPGALAAAAQQANARVLHLCKGDPEVDENGLIWHAIDPSSPEHTDMIFLGKLDGQPLFARPSGPSEQHIPARAAAMQMPHRDTAIYGQAKSFLDWHYRHPHCARCGGRTEMAAGGAKRICSACEAEHFPRVDPVVIMLAQHEDKVLLGRQASWPPGVWSALAGFVEPAETLEEACARELQEEAGVSVDIAATRYIFCQPWPFPSSIMVGLVAPALSDELSVDTQELEAARWFSRDDVRAMLAGTHPHAALPPSIAIARRLAELWAEDKI